MNHEINMIEQWLYWPPAQPYEDKYFFSEINFTSTEWTIELTKNNKWVVLFFKNGIIHYRCSQELFCIVLWDVLIDCKFDYGRRTFFMVKNSTYVQTIHQSVGVQYLTDLLHFCLICDDVVIDIIASHEPELTFSLQSDPDPMPQA